MPLKGRFLGVFAAAATVVWPQAIHADPQLPARDGDQVRLASSVLLDDGMPAASPITVELICQGVTRARTETGESGGFSLALVSAEEAQPDCSLHASLAGYRSGSVPVAEMPDAPSLAAITLQRAGKYQGEAISVTWLGAPESARKAFHSGIREMRRGDEASLTEAARSFEAAAAEYPRYAAAWYELGRLRLAAGDASGARQAFRGAVAADPWFVSPYEPLLLMELGEQNWPEVRRLSEQMLAMNPYLSKASYYRGIASVKLGELETARQAAAAIEQGPEAEQSSPRPDSAAPLTALGAVLFHNERYLQSAIAYNQAERIAPLGELSRFTLATAYIAMDRRHWARPELEKLAAMNPRNAVYPYWLAGVDYFYQWFDDAIAKLRTSIELDPDFAPAYDRLGQCLEGAGNPDEALAAYEKAIMLNKTQGNGSPWAAWHLGSLLHDLGRLSDAEDALREALQNARDSPRVYYDLGVVLRKQGKLKEAREVLLRAAELDPADPKPHYALAEVYRRSGDKRKALAELEEFQGLSGRR